MMMLLLTPMMMLMVVANGTMHATAMMIHDAI